MMAVKAALRLVATGLISGAVTLASAHAQQINAASQSTTTTERGVRVTRGPVIVQDSVLERSLAGAPQRSAPQRIVINVRPRFRPRGLVIHGFQNREWRINGSHGPYPNRAFGIVRR